MPSRPTIADREFGELGRWLIARLPNGKGWGLWSPDACDFNGHVEHFPTFDDARLAFIAKVQTA